MAGDGVPERAVSEYYKVARVEAHQAQITPTETLQGAKSRELTDLMSIRVFGTGPGLRRNECPLAVVKSTARKPWTVALAGG